MMINVMNCETIVDTKFVAETSKLGTQLESFLKAMKLRGRYFSTCDSYDTILAIRSCFRGAGDLSRSQPLAHDVQLTKRAVQVHIKEPLRWKVDIESWVWSGVIYDENSGLILVHVPLNMFVKPGDTCSLHFEADTLLYISR